MKIIFLDIDGVLNCESTKQRFNDVVGIDPTKVTILQRILDQTNAHLVLSSSWRIDQDWRKGLSEAGLSLEHIVGTTGRDASRIRGEEINTWFDKSGEIHQYAILDDGSDMLQGQPHFKTTWKEGLTDEIADAMIKHLNTPQIWKCLCDNPQCAKCLGVNCQDNDCLVHTQERKTSRRQLLKMQRSSKI